MYILRPGLGILCSIGLCFGIAPSIYASFDDAVAALKSNDTERGMSLLTDAANAGDVKAMRKLGDIYLNGDGVPKNPNEALKWFQAGARANDALSMSGAAFIYLTGQGVPQDVATARQLAKASADLNEPSGEWLYYLTVATGPELRYLVNGVPDMGIYSRLAKRSIEERALDIAGYSALAKALNQHYPQASISAITELTDRSAPGNRDLALRLLQQMPQLSQQLTKVREMLEIEKRFGESFAKPGMFVDVLRTASAAAATRAKASPGGTTNLVKTTISQPLSGAVFLPVSVQPFDHFYLVEGHWEETWTFKVGNTSVDVPIDFQADGLGGANYQTKSSW